MFKSKIILTVASILTVLIVKPVFAVTAEESKILGQKVGESVCKAVWIDNPITQAEAFAISRANINLDYEEISNLEEIIILIEKYNIDHPVTYSYFSQMHSVINENCPKEFWELQTAQ